MFLYHFVRFGDTWYLKPEIENHIVDHYQKILKREFEDGFNDYKDSMKVVKGSGGKPVVMYSTHGVMPWRNAVMMLMRIKNLSWIQAAHELEKKTLEDRINIFRQGKKLYLANGLNYFVPKDGDDIPDDDVYTVDLVYPYTYDYDRVVYMMNEVNQTWSARIGNIMVYDKYGKRSWCSRYVAKDIAKKFCECEGDWKKLKGKE